MTNLKKKKKKQERTFRESKNFFNKSIDQNSQVSRLLRSKYLFLL